MGIESTQVARSTPFDNSTNSFTAENTQEAIEEVAALVGSPNFSYKIIPGSTTITVPIYQEMSVFQEMELLSDADLVLIGDLVVYG